MIWDRCCDDGSGINRGWSTIFRTVILLGSAFGILLSPPPLVAESPSDGDGVRILYLIRHGQYDHEDELERLLIPKCLPRHLVAP